MVQKRRKQGRVKTSKLPLKREFSAGGAVYKRKKKETLWLIIKPKSYERWQLPKGMIDKGETSLKAAVREVKEEGGVVVKAGEKIDAIQYFFVFEGKKVFKTVTYFLMEYQKESKAGPDKNEIDEVAFLSFKEAFNKLSFKADKDILSKAKETLNRGIQGNLV